MDTAASAEPNKKTRSILDVLLRRRAKPDELVERKILRAEDNPLSASSTAPAKNLSKEEQKAAKKRAKEEAKERAKAEKERKKKEKQEAKEKEKREKEEKEKAKKEGKEKE